MDSYIVVAKPLLRITNRIGGNIDKPKSPGRIAKEQAVFGATLTAIWSYWGSLLTSNGIIIASVSYIITLGKMNHYYSSFFLLSSFLSSAIIVDKFKSARRDWAGLYNSYIQNIPVSNPPKKGLFRRVAIKLVLLILSVQAVMLYLFLELTY